VADQLDEANSIGDKGDWRRQVLFYVPDKMRRNRITHVCVPG
jgi:hypothetical protein